jgi:hypothetical protein
MGSPYKDRIEKLEERLMSLQIGIKQGKTAKLDICQSKLKALDAFV